MQIQVPQQLKKLSKLMHNNLFVVGGYIRNSLMGLPLDDIDICSDVTVENLVTLCAGTEFDVKIKSKFLGTAIISVDDQKYEYSCFRKEVYSEDGAHTPSEVEFIADVREDARRRDFTINAIYYDISKDELLDFYTGVSDINNKILRTIETPEFVLSHDGVRILRLFRFQAELNFKIDKETLATAVKYAKNMKSLSGERLAYEIEKILHSSKRYPRSKNNAFLKTFKIFNKYGLWKNLGIDVVKIRLKMVKKAEHKTQGFLVDLIDTVNPISVSYYLQHFLSDSIGLNKKNINNLINILSGYYDALNGLDNKNYFFKYFENFPTINKLLIHKSKFLSSKYEFFYKYIISHKVVIQIKDLKINGDDLRKKAPSVDPKRYKAILNSLLSDVFDGKVQNNKQELLKAVESKLKYL